MRPAGSGAAAVAAVLAVGVASLWLGTDGLTAFTAETVRRNAVAKSPRILPEMSMQNQDGEPTGLATFAGKVVLMDFIYTRCPTICIAQGSDFEQARAAIRDAGLADHVALVTVSFDPEFDGPDELTEYAGRFGGADPVWQFLRADPAGTRAMLNAAEVIVIPDEFGGFVHNAAIHVLDRQGRLVRILDSDAWGEALALAQDLM